MKCSGPVGLVLAATLCLVHSMPTETSTTRSTPAIGDTIKKLTNQLMEVNSTTFDMVYDARTPPKVKQQQKIKLKEEMESSHAGVAIPVDEDSLDMEEPNKKFNFQKIERPTTDSGLSTWILLSGQTSATTKSPSTRKPVIKPNLEAKPKQNLTASIIEKPNRIVKPIFKRRPTTTTIPTAATKITTTAVATKITTTEAAIKLTTTAPITSTTTKTRPTNKLTKVKASILNNALKKYSTTTTGPTKPTPTTETSVTTTVLTTKKNATPETTMITTEFLPAEAKDGEADLPETTTENKKKKNGGKRKKNKNKRRKPTDKQANNTSLSKPAKKTAKEKPVGTQIYNYLSRELMPAVGVGLAGIMVITAGLASYYLYPFAAARRTYEVDRKDKEGAYYYHDAYSGGMPEEEAIGKVIAGMPGQSLFGNSYKAPTSRKTAPNTKYRLADRRAQIQPQFVQGSVEDVPMTPKRQDHETFYDNPQNYQSNSYEPITYSNELNPQYSPLEDQQFVVGSLPKEVIEEATPVAVPEHGPRTFNLEEMYAEEPNFIVNNTPDRVYAKGPRSLKIRRKRRDIPNEIENEIDSALDKEEVTTLGDHTETTDLVTDTTPLSSTTKDNQTTTTSFPATSNLPDRFSSFIDLIKEIMHVKARVGLQVVQNATQSISGFISKLQSRLDQQYRNYRNSKH